MPPRIWRDSTDERLVNDWQDHDLDGFVWGVRWQVMYPGAELVAKSKAADSWSRQLGQPFYEALIDASGHRISLVFADLVIDRVELGYAPFTVNDS